MYTAPILRSRRRKTTRPMIMERRVAAILLTLSVAGLTAAAGSGDTDIIRLPSDGNGNEEDERPWKCCDLIRCTRRQPPSCQCLDRVDQCSDACRECVAVEGAREVCADWYRGEPPPRCGNKDAARTAGTVVTGARKNNKKKKREDDERPPWKCCDRSVPGPSATWPPVWYCMDKFAERCDCKRCMDVEDSRNYFCLDGYKGRDPGPSCTNYR